MLTTNDDDDDDDAAGKDGLGLGQRHRPRSHISFIVGSGVDLPQDVTRLSCLVCYLDLTEIDQSIIHIESCYQLLQQQTKCKPIY